MRDQGNGEEGTATRPDEGRDAVDDRLRGVTPSAIPGPGGEARTAAPSEDLTRIAALELRVPTAILVRELRELNRAPANALPARARRALTAIDHQVRAIADLSAAFRELEALDHADPQPRRTPVELGSVLERVVAARAPAAKAAGIRVEAVVGEQPVTVGGDPERIARAIDAAIDAIWRSVGRGGTIRLQLQGTSDGARIDIEARVARHRPARSRPRLGTAFLAIARKIALLHGGALEIVHERGLVSARIALPALPPSSAEARRAPSPALGPAQILVVDDDQDAREALSMLLGDDFDVRLAGDGHEALEHAMQERPDLVLMDLYMPRMDGLAALEALRAEPTTEDIPVILVSARGDEITRSRCLDLGAVDFLQKPFSGRELRARIERTLRLTRRETELQALARTDPLTGLANLRAFRSRLDEEVKRARRYRTSLSCVMVDMDNLKPINDELGHAAGDQAIRAVADVIRHELRETDFGARYGGDEFVLLLPHTSGAEARVFAERVCARLGASPIQVDGRTVPLAASFGIAALGDETVDRPGETLVRRADAALYVAKRSGRGRVAAHPSASADGATSLS